MVNLNIRVDENLKQDVENIFGKLGLTTSDAIRIFFSQVRNCRGIPFELKLYDEPTETAVKIMAETEQDIISGNVSKGYTDSNSLMADLLKE